MLVSEQSSRPVTTTYNRSIDISQSLWPDNGVTLVTCSLRLPDMLAYDLHHLRRYEQLIFDHLHSRVWVKWCISIFWVVRKMLMYGQRGSDHYNKTGSQCRQTWCSPQLFISKFGFMIQANLLSGPFVVTCPVDQSAKSCRKYMLARSVPYLGSWVVIDAFGSAPAVYRCERSPTRPTYGQWHNRYRVYCKKLTGEQVSSNIVRIKYCAEFRVNLTQDIRLRQTGLDLWYSGLVPRHPRLRYRHSYSHAEAGRTTGVLCWKLRTASESAVSRCVVFLADLSIRQRPIQRHRSSARSCSWELGTSASFGWWSCTEY